MMDHNIIKPPAPLRISFVGIFIRSTRAYKTNFINYFLIALASYFPFLIFELVSSVDILNLIDFFHGNFLDIIIFLTLPTLVKNHRVFPITTLQLFTQNFFLHAVLLTFIQFGVIFLSISLMIQVSIGAVLIGIVPYIFILFAGFFLVLNNSTHWIKINHCLLQSIQVVKGNFMTVFSNFVLITIFVITPVIFYSMWYLSSHNELIKYISMLQMANGQDFEIGQELITIVQEIVNEETFRWGRLSIHIILQPLKSLFLSFLFIEIMNHLSPKIIDRYLGLDNEVNPQETQSGA